MAWRPPINGKRDANEADIVSALRKAGAEVWLMDTPCDLLVAFRGCWYLIEVKASEADARRKTSTAQRQQEHRDRAERCGCIIHVVTDKTGALAAIGAIKGDTTC